MQKALNLLISDLIKCMSDLSLEFYTRHDLRTGFQRKLSCKPLTGLTRLTDYKLT